MSTYAPLLSLTVEHAYFSGARAPEFKFTPSAVCAQMLRHWDLSLRQEENRLEIWQTLADIPPTKVVSEELCFCFDIEGIDPLFWFYTDLPKTGLNFASKVLAEAEGAALIASEVEYLAADQQPATEKQDALFQQAGRITVELHGIQLHTNSCAKESSAISRVIHPIKQYVVPLKSKGIHWKYFFSGSLAKKKLHIVDLDAEENGLGIGFVDSSLAATKDGLAMISTSAIAMRHRPSQGFQLREAGAGERILVERLPNASLTKIGKEKGRDGASMVVAEIYIHQ